MSAQQQAPQVVPVAKVTALLGGLLECKSAACSKSIADSSFCNTVTNTHTLSATTSAPGEADGPAVGSTEEQVRRSTQLRTAHAPQRSERRRPLPLLLELPRAPRGPSSRSLAAACSCSSIGSPLPLSPLALLLSSLPSDLKLTTSTSYHLVHRLCEPRVLALD